ncbi:ATP-binding cassette domain-containing protein [bacterium]|nr:ATP-binding cassette domain-containing protein [bacterium]
MRKSTFILMISIFLFIALLEIASPIIMGQMIHQGIKQGRQGVIIYLIQVLLFISCGIGLLSFVRSKLFTRFEILVINQLQSSIMQRMLKLPLSYFDKFAVGELSHRILMLKSLTRPFNPGLLSAVLSFICSFITFGVMLCYAWQLTLCIVALLSIFLLITSWIVIDLLAHQEKYTDEMGNGYRFLFQVVYGISRIKLFAREKAVETAWDKIYSQAQYHLSRVYRLGVLRFTLFSNIQLVILFVLFFITAHGYKNTIPVEHFIIFFVACTQFISRFLTFYINSNELLPAIIAYKRIKPLLLAPLEKTAPPFPVTRSFQPAAAIRIKNLHFKYPTSKTQIFTGLDCSITAGEHIAFVGLSGSGKSTLFKLLLGFYFAQHGDIYYDEHPIQAYDLVALRQQIGVVFQDSKLFNGSILENIVGHVGASEAEAWRVINLVGLNAWISSLPMGLHTNVVQHINLISGGQKQLLMIARALVGNPRVLLFDEATNSLDNKAQALVVDRINHLNLTRISIAHRLSTIEQANKILVLHQGKIIESGTYQQLLNQQGLFYQLAKQQHQATSNIFLDSIRSANTIVS